MKGKINTQFYIDDSDSASGVVVFMQVLKKGVSARYYFGLPKVIDSNSAKIIANEIAKIPWAFDVDLRSEKFGNDYYDTIFLTMYVDFDVVEDDIKKILQKNYLKNNNTPPNPIATNISTTLSNTSSNISTSGIGLYQSALLTALNVSPNVQAILSKDILDSAYVIYEIQKLYAQTPEGDRKNQLALAIAEGSRILLSEINKISINKPIQSIPSKKQYEVGDMFRVKADTDEIPRVILRIDSINNNTISLDAYIVDRNNASTPTTTEGVAITKFDDLVNSGEYIPFDYTKIVDVGDTFVVDISKFTYLIKIVNKEKNEIEYDLKYTINNNVVINNHETSIIYFIALIKENFLQKYVATQNVVTPSTPPTPPSPPTTSNQPNTFPYKVGDIFVYSPKNSSSGYFKIVEIVGNEVYFNVNDTIQGIDNPQNLLSFPIRKEFVIKNVTDNIWVKVEEPKNTQTPPTPPSPPTPPTPPSAPKPPSTPPTPPTPPSAPKPPSTPPTPPTPPSAPKPPSTPPTPPTPPKFRNPKMQKPKTPPKPPTPPSMPQLSCQEIKEAIKGLTLLAKLGDDESIQTIKTLKDTLKTQNCK